jgi:hypothetical protein
MAVLLDEASTPPVRTILTRLLATADEADLAVSKVRLVAVDLTTAEAAAVGRCRFLLGRLEAEGLSELHAGSGTGHLAALHALLLSGRIEIRSAGVHAWVPDFSIFRGVRSPTSPATVAVLGAHYFREPPATDGPSLTCVIGERQGVDVLSRRFQTLWKAAHDVQAVVLHTVERSLMAER